jgi:hypothetical protein
VREKQQRAAAQRNASFSMLKEPEPAARSVADKAQRKMQRKLRKKAAREEEEEEEPPPAKKAANESESERTARLRQEDQNEMHAFADRLKDRDDARTKKSRREPGLPTRGGRGATLPPWPGDPYPLPLGFARNPLPGTRRRPPWLTGSDRPRLEDDVEPGRELEVGKDGDKLKAMEELRVRSREDYLTKRESQKLQALADDIKDEDYLFGDLNLTKRELAQRSAAQLKIALTAGWSCSARAFLQLQRPTPRRDKAGPRAAPGRCRRSSTRSRWSGKTSRRSSTRAGTTCRTPTPRSTTRATRPPSRLPSLDPFLCRA